MEDLAPASVLAYADRVDAAPDGCCGLRRRGRLDAVAVSAGSK